jgi:signal peptidase I
MCLPTPGPPIGSTESRAERPGSRLSGWLINVVVFVVAAFAALMLLPALFGLERYVITGDSMEGTHDRGSIVFSEVVPVEDLRVGDVITYEPPPSAGSDGFVTHRILSIRDQGEGRPVLRTKGDANESADPWRFRLPGEEQARAVAGVPYVGYIFGALGVRELRMALIGVPALLLAAGLLVGLWRQAGEEAAAARSGRTEAA